MSEPCRIMDDEELECASRVIPWRNGNSFQIRNLFVPARVTADFPRAFQPGRPSAFIFRQKWSTVVKGSALYRPLVDISGTPVLTAESIAEFGVPLLPMPELKLPASWEDDPPYAPCTPPPAVEEQEQESLERK